MVPPSSPASWKISAERRTVWGASRFDREVHVPMASPPPLHAFDDARRDRVKENQVRHGGQRHPPAEPLRLAEREAQRALRLVPSPEDLVAQTEDPFLRVDVVLDAVHDIAQRRIAELLPDLLPARPQSALRHAGHAPMRGRRNEISQCHEDPSGCRCNVCSASANLGGDAQQTATHSDGLTDRRPRRSSSSWKPREGNTADARASSTP